MRFLLFLLFPSLAFCSELQLEKKTLDQIGLKVWQNECRATVDGLITWIPGDEFPSLGIGHFIWYPTGATKRFEEGFPPLIQFLEEKLKERDQKIPSWIKSKKGFPWKSRESFLEDKRSKKMQQLRELLSTTLDLQIAFLYDRFHAAEGKIIPQLTEKQKIHLNALKKSSQGIYALIDYVNFKGTGLSESERYRGEGWGLLQVLQNIPEDTPGAELVSAFATSGKKVLARRVHNAPIHRKEDRWLNGWYKRLETYSK